jgi:hypothetical protein
MYNYYKNAWVCLAYFNDVTLDAVTRRTTKAPRIPDGSRDIAKAKTLYECMKNSRWWKRGWTLQELIAPQSLIFYAQDWTYICDKHFVTSHLLEFTNISSDVLQGLDPMTASIAQECPGRQTERQHGLKILLLFAWSVRGKPAFAVWRG